MSDDKPLHQAMLRGFLIGIASGLGAALGATLVLGLLVYILGHIDFIPVVGNYIKAVVDYINAHHR